MTAATVLLGLLALVVGTLGGWPLTAWVLRVAARSADSGPADDRPTALRGGTWIGLLERLAVTGSLLAGYPSGVAFVIAVKGLGRYPELREHPDASERFVIGTFASMLWASVVGVVARLLLA